MPEDAAPRTPPPPQTFPQSYAAPLYGAGGFARPLPPPRSAWFYIATIGGSLALVALVISGIIWSTLRSVDGGSMFGSNEIAVIDVTGVIVSADKIDTQLRTYADDD